MSNCYNGYMANNSTISIPSLTEDINVGTVSAASPDPIAAPDPDHKRRLRIIIYPFNQHLCKYVYINIPSF